MSACGVCGKAIVDDEYVVNWGSCTWCSFWDEMRYFDHFDAPKVVIAIVRIYWQALRRQRLPRFVAQG